MLLRNNPGNSGDVTALFLEQSNGGLDNGRLLLLQNNNATQPAYCVGSVSGGVATVYQGFSGTGGGGDSFKGGLCIGAGSGGGGVTHLNGETGSVSLVAGTGITVTPGGSTITISASGGGGGVTSLNGETGGVTLAAGSGISISAMGSTITVSASGGGGGGLSTTIGYTKPGGATGTLTFTNGLLTAST